LTSPIECWQIRLQLDILYNTEYLIQWMWRKDCCTCPQICLSRFYGSHFVMLYFSFSISISNVKYYLLTGIVLISESGAL